MFEIMDAADAVKLIDDGAEEIVIRCKEKTDRVAYLLSTIGRLTENDEMMLYIGHTEYYVSKDEILFFETYDGKVYAHTRDRMYSTTYKLFEIEAIMSANFVRISKSVIVNIRDIRSLQRELSGNGEITFKASDKTTRFSRGY